MANQLDEMNPVIMDEGRDVNVIAKQIPVTLTSTENMIPTIFYGIAGVIALIGLFAVLRGNSEGFVGVLIGAGACFIVYKKLKDASAYFSGLEQKINAAASEIDNQMEKRIIVLENAASLIEKSINLDKEVFIDLAKYRSGNFTPAERQNLDSDLRAAERSINVALENYPDLRSQAAIMNGMQENSYLQREITAARSAYNDAVYQWNREIFVFPFNKIVAAREGKTTRIPFIASKEVKEASRGNFFK